jgi:predicted nucleic acid-binding protein
LRRVTHRRLWQVTQSSINQALGQVEVWSNAPAVILLAEPPGFLPVWAEVLRSSAVTGGQVHDARIAALCLHHGISEVWAVDRDFSRFPRLKVRNPLVA